MPPVAAKGSPLMPSPLFYVAEGSAMIRRLALPVLAVALAMAPGRA